MWTPCFVGETHGKHSWTPSLDFILRTSTLIGSAYSRAWVNTSSLPFRRTRFSRAPSTFHMRTLRCCREPSLVRRPAQSPPLHLVPFPLPKPPQRRTNTRPSSPSTLLMLLLLQMRMFSPQFPCARLRCIWKRYSLAPRWLIPISVDLTQNVLS